MKNILIKILCLLGLTGCSPSSNIEKGIFLYDTPEYNELVKTSKFSLADTEKIICDSIEKNILLYTDDKNITKHHFALSKNLSLRHYLIYKDDYVFIYRVPTHAGTIEISSALFVNRNTGKLVQKPYKDENERVSIRIGSEYYLNCNKK